MKSDYHSQLCLCILQDHFGDIVKAVALEISRNEESTLNLLCSVLKGSISVEDVKKALLVLYHHNCLSVENSNVSEGSGNLKLIYKLNVKSIVYRLLFPKMLLWVKNHINVVTAAYLQVIFQNGCMSTSTLYSEVVSFLNSDDESAENSHVYTIEDIKCEFETLISSRFLVSVLPFTRIHPSLTASDTVEEVETKKKTVAPPRKKRNAGDTKTVPDQDDILPLELRMMRADVISEVSPVDVTEIVDSAPDTKKKPSKKRKADDNDDVAPITASSSLSESSAAIPTLWRVDWDQYLRILRHNWCVLYVREKMGALAGHMCKLLLDYSVMSESGYLSDISAPMSVTSLFNAYKQSNFVEPVNNKGNNVTVKTELKLDSFNSLLKLLELNNIFINVLPGDSHFPLHEKGPCISVKLAAVMENVKTRTIHDIICEKYGIYSGRIVQLLQKHKYLEQQKISDLGIIPSKEAREKLDKWVNYYEVSKSLSGSNAYSPASTVYLWYYNNIDGNLAHRSLLKNLHMSLYKMLIRYRQEIEDGRLLVEVGQDTSSVKRNDDLTTSDSPVIEETDTVEQFQLRICRLFRSILGVLETVIVMEL